MSKICFACISILHCLFVVWSKCRFIKMNQQGFEMPVDWSRACKTPLAGYFLVASWGGFFPSDGRIWAWLSKVTGILTSADWTAGLGRGASNVSVPSGESDEWIVAGSMPSGNLRKQTEWQLGVHELMTIRYTCASCSHFGIDFQFTTFSCENLTRTETQLKEPQSHPKQVYAKVSPSV